MNGYIAYINLDYLELVFADRGWQGQPDLQQEYVEALHERLEGLVLEHKGKPGVLTTFSWYDKDGSLRRAIEVVPVAASAKGLQIVTPDVTVYNELNFQIDAMKKEILRLQSELGKLEVSTKRNFRAMLRGDNDAVRATFHREHGGLTEQFEKHKEMINNGNHDHREEIR